MQGLLGLLALTVGLQATAWGQFLDSNSRGPRLGDSVVQYWQAGMIITAGAGPCQGLVGTAPLPVDWPEQEAKIIETDFSPKVKVSYRTVEGTVNQMVVEVPFLQPGEECRAVVTLEVTRHSQRRPENTDEFVLPDKRKLPRDVRPYLGPSPEIESTASRIKALARQFDPDEGKAWDAVEAIYDWVRENVEHKPGNQGGAMAALKAGAGDHEDLASLFIALCRASGVPARTVWVKGYCYPEFYLEDQEGNGHWFPCQLGATGNAVFGEMPDHRPILQKGDNFRSPNNPRERKRFLAETLKVGSAAAKPSVKWVRDLVSR
jgi:hypothetical protein